MCCVFRSQGCWRRLRSERSSNSSLVLSALESYIHTYIYGPAHAHLWPHAQRWLCMQQQWLPLVCTPCRLQHLHSSFLSLLARPCQQHGCGLLWTVCYSRQCVCLGSAGGAGAAAPVAPRCSLTPAVLRCFHIACICRLCVVFRHVLLYMQPARKPCNIAIMSLYVRNMSLAAT